MKPGGGAHLLLKEGEPVVEAHGWVRAGSHSHCGDASELVEHVERELRFRKDLRSHATSKEHTVSNTGPQLGTNKRAEEMADRGTDKLGSTRANPFNSLIHTAHAGQLLWLS